MRCFKRTTTGNLVGTATTAVLHSLPNPRVGILHEHTCTHTFGFENGSLFETICSLFFLGFDFQKLEIHSYIMAMLYCTSAVATEAISNYFEFLSNSGFIYLFCNTVK